MRPHRTLSPIGGAATRYTLLVEVQAILQPMHNLTWLEVDWRTTTDMELTVRIVGEDLADIDFGERSRRDGRSRLFLGIQKGQDVVDTVPVTVGTATSRRFSWSRLCRMEGRTFSAVCPRDTRGAFLLPLLAGRGRGRQERHVRAR